MEALIKSADKTKTGRNAVVCLVSGGIDSPIATWLMIREGLTPTCVYFDNAPYADETKLDLEAMVKRSFESASAQFV